MSVQLQLCFLLFGTCLFSFLLLLECRKLEGYDFPVFSTKKCPGNQAEWKKRSSAINCTEQNGYMCLPNENLTDLLEFCYIYPRILVQKDLCLYLDKRFSKVNSYNCRRFTHGCPELHYFSSDTYLYQSCMEIENGCFSAEPSCKRKPLRSEHSFDATTLAINLGVSIPICLLCILAFSVIGFKYGICKKRSDTVRGDEESELLLCGYESIDKNKEYPIEEVTFDQWEKEDINFISTKACKEVEKKIKSRNLVIVAGHSGSGKSAIIQHIALQYRKQGWIVKKLEKVEDIVKERYSSRFQKDKIICFFNNPLGKESFDEIFNDSWQTYEEELKVYLTTAKLLMSCRSHIISDTRVVRHLVNQAAIVDIDDKKYKFSVDEKRQILTKYTPDMNLSHEDCDEIIKVERYFPLLCKLYSRKEEYRNKGKSFFIKPVTVLNEELKGFRKKNRVKYCALALLFLFNDDFCISDLLRNNDTENKFKLTLKRCGLPENTPPSAIGDTLDSLKGFFVKSIGDTYHFYHDLVMEVTGYEFGTEHPTATIQYADIGFLRKRVQLGYCKEDIDPFIVYLSDNYTEKLGERLFSELFGNRLIDVVLNPCLKTKRMIETLKKIIQKNSEKLPMLLKKKKLKFKKQKYYTAKQVHLSKLAFIGLENEISPLFVLIVFSHTDLSLVCLDTLQRMQANFKSSFLLSAVYCNGAMELFQKISKDCDEESLTKDWGGFSPNHIVSVFHNYEILEELIRVGVHVNSLTRTGDPWTPLQLATGIDTNKYGSKNHGEPDKPQRCQTVQLLLRNGAEINLCNRYGGSPLYLACQNGYESTVQLLLSNEADINLCTKDGTSPLFIACQNGHDSTVKLLLSNGADINLCTLYGASPLYIACQTGHDSTVQLLLSNGADINLCNKYWDSPLYIACQKGHDSTVQLLLSNGADINLCTKNGISPLYIACRKEHESTVQLLLSNGADINLCTKNRISPLYIACQNGHDSTVKLLLSNGADINLCNEDEDSPLFIACQNGHENTVEFLLSNGADINLCNKNWESPLYIACQNGNDSTVQLLLSNGANINLCNKYGDSVLHIACNKGHESTVQLLLRNGAVIDLCSRYGVSPLYIACQNGHDSTVQLLLSNGADINLYAEDGDSPLYIACKNGHDSTVQLLLSNGADINLCTVEGFSPLYIACLNEQNSTVQLLLMSKDVDINFCEKSFATSPLYIACENGHHSTVELLLKNRADINLYTENRVSPLYIACQKGHDSTVELLLKNGADINLCTEDGASPLHIACQNGHDSTVKFLLRYWEAICINVRNKYGDSPLYIACQKGHVSTVKLLLSYGADINLYTEDGTSPLYIACQNGHDSTVQLLLRNRANINLYTENRVSPLYVACQNGHDSTVELLLKNGADINLCTVDGASPLYIACQNGNESTVKLLQSNGADINLCTKDRVSPLYIACQKGRGSTVKLLLMNKNLRNINLCTDDGVSPLFLVCRNGHDSKVQLLLSNGADINLCDKYGASPLYIACQNGHDSTVKLLLSNGAEKDLCLKYGVSPLYCAFQRRHYEIVNILIKNGVDIGLSCGVEVNPDLKDCFNENKGVVEFLLQKDNILNNMYDLDSFFSLFVSSQVERVTRLIFDR